MEQYKNYSWQNERSVELPVIKQIYNDYHDKKILEIGNVYKQYFGGSHTIIDKFEKGNNIINQDISSCAIGGKYDLIFSISTFEHIGFDEDANRIFVKERLIQAISNVKRSLKKGGRLVITFPIGYNRTLESLIKNNCLRFNKILFLKRTSQKNTWVETQENVYKLNYNYPYPFANGLIVAEFVNN